MSYYLVVQIHFITCVITCVSSCWSSGWLMGLYDFVMSSEGINVKEFTFFKMNFVFYYNVSQMCYKNLDDSGKHKGKQITPILLPRQSHLNIRTTALWLVKQSHLDESLLFIFKFHILFKLSSFIILPPSFLQKSRLFLVIHLLPGTHALWESST